MKKNALAGLTPAGFMRGHWQKKPLFAPLALPEYAGVVTRDNLFALAQCDDVESRIVQKSRGSWRVRQGPFAPTDLARLPRAGWTLLVQGVDQKLWPAARLLQEFSFIPYARLDDVMVSYAAPGGGVGPHFDSYDVFLLQGLGQRRWQVSRQRDLELIDEAPVKILQRFVPTQEWLVNPGDLLYLPPKCAHNGIAVSECITYSIGFRASSAQELGQRFLEFLEDRLELQGTYADPQLRATATPGRLPQQMKKRAAVVLDQLRWGRSDIDEFLGIHLTEPKANVIFGPPRRCLAQGPFFRRIHVAGIRLSLPSRMLTSGRRIFMNGEASLVGRGALMALQALADRRRLEPSFELDGEAARLLYNWYCVGYVEIGTQPGRRIG